MTDSFDIIIVGGGFAGLTAALTIAGKTPNIKIALLEKNDIVSNDKQRDGRAFAISKSSMDLFAEIRIKEEIEEFAGKIKKIEIIDGDSPFYLHFDTNNDCEIQNEDNALGSVIENFHIHNALRNKVLEKKNIELICPDFYEDISFENSQVSVVLGGNKKTITAKLLLACDGRFSPLRKKFDIDTFSKSYNQGALVFNISHSEDHNNIALEKFLPEGPFAILPMKDQKESSVVWTVKSDMAQTICSLDQENFLNQLKKRSGEYLGEIAVTTKPIQYNLDLISAKKYYYKRMALVGDVAHGMHPIAGQGFNVGIDDIKVLSDLLEEYFSCGLDIGSETLLLKYHKLRKFGAGKMIFATDSLNALFANKILPIKLARNLGIGIIEKIPKLKKFFIKNAGGL